MHSNDEFCIQMTNFADQRIEIAERTEAPVDVCGNGVVSQNYEFCIQNEKFCIKHDEFCIKHDELCIKHDELCIKHDECCSDGERRSTTIKKKTIAPVCTCLYKYEDSSIENEDSSMIFQ